MQWYYCHYPWPPTTQLTLNGIPVPEYIAQVNPDGAIATGTTGALSCVHVSYSRRSLALLVCHFIVQLQYDSIDKYGL